MLRGVMGLIEKDGKFLFGTEAKEVSYKGKWRLLGGKLEGNENAEETMVRESMEESGVKIKVIGFLGEIKCEGDRGDIIVEMCYSKWVSGELKPAPREIGILKWFSLEEAKKLDKDMVSTKALELFKKKQDKI